MALNASKLYSFMRESGYEMESKDANEFRSGLLKNPNKVVELYQSLKDNDLLDEEKFNSVGALSDYLGVGRTPSAAGMNLPAATPKPAQATPAAASGNVKQAPATPAPASPGVSQPVIAATQPQETPVVVDFTGVKEEPYLIDESLRR